MDLERDAPRQYSEFVYIESESNGYIRYCSKVHFSIHVPTWTEYVLSDCQ
jgi:hypothetical protein